MVATKRRFNANLQKVRIDDAGTAAPSLPLIRERITAEGQPGAGAR